MQAFFEMLYN